MEFMRTEFGTETGMTPEVLIRMKYVFLATEDFVVVDPYSVRIKKMMERMRNREATATAVLRVRVACRN